jgi:hypothetical protein
MSDPSPTTQELRLQQIERERTERAEADDAPTEEAELAHERRADKAAYLREKLTEPERSDTDA